MGIETVVVASKVEMSISAQLQEKIDEQKTNGPHTWVESRWRFYGDIHCITGTSAARGQLPQGYLPPDIANGAALSTLPKAFAEQWFAQNALLPPVKNGLIFMCNDRRYASDKAREIEKLKSGFEPLIPNEMNEHTGKVIVNDPRWPKGRAVPIIHYGAGQAPEVSVGPDPRPDEVSVS
jgi:hypothetical protein